MKPSVFCSKTYPHKYTWSLLHGKTLSYRFPVCVFGIKLTELRAADLRFTSTEAAIFLNQVMGLNLTEEDITTLETRTEGWIAGLQLAAISLQGRLDASNFIKSFSGSHRLVLDYLIEEVLNQQPEYIQNFLLETAILDQFTGSLCDAIHFDSDEPPYGQSNGQTILELLDRTNLFIIPLDIKRRWYRYHHLFADLLRQKLHQLQPKQIPTLHLRASKWYEQQFLHADAIHHAIAAEDFERAANLAELAWPDWNESYKSITWFNWVKDLPDELVRVRPVLSAAFAWALMNAGQLEEAEKRLMDAERWLVPAINKENQPNLVMSEMVIVDEAQFHVLPSRLATIRSYHAQAIGDTQAVLKYVHKTLNLLPEDDYFNRASITGLLGLTYWASGNLKAALKVFSDGLFLNVHDTIKGTFVLADMQMTLGNLHEALNTCEHGLSLAKTFEEPNPIGTEDIFSIKSQIQREMGNLEAAAQDLNRCKKLGEQVDLQDWQSRYCIAQAQLAVSQRRFDDALDYLYEAERVFVRTPLPMLRPIPAMIARVWIRQGKLTQAMGWARDQNLSVNGPLSYQREYEYTTMIRVFITSYKSDPENNSIHDSIKLLTRLQKAAEEETRAGSLIEILILQALACEALEKIPASLKYLERALNLAEPEGFFQVFVDEGPTMAHLLVEALRQGFYPNYVQKLLAAFPDIKNEPITAAKSPTSDSDLIEPLSEREIDVLHLIAKGMSNAEIANQLYLSRNTVKAHTRNIYGKLGVNNRTQAGARARALGLITE